jgi:hypothetical protein
MENLVTARHFEIYESEVLRKKRLTLIAKEEFCIYDLFQTIKLLKGKDPKTKIKLITLNPLIEK